MSTTKCPKCEGEVLLPASTDAAARVQCPLCDEEYTLGDVLEKLPPVLVLLDVPTLAETASDGGEFGAMLDGDGPDGGFSFEPDSETGGLSFEESGESSGEPFAASSATSTATTATRKKKPPKSIGKEIVKIVLGGVAGLLIAYGILLWGFKQDPMELTPGLPAWMSWAVPSQFHNATKDPKPKVVKKQNGAKEKRRETNNATPKPKDKTPSSAIEPRREFTDPGVDIDRKFDRIDDASTSDGGFGNSTPNDAPPETSSTDDPDAGKPFDPLAEPDNGGNTTELPSLDEPNEIPSDIPEIPGLDEIPPADPPLGNLDKLPDGTGVPEDDGDTDDSSPEPDAATLRTAKPISVNDFDAQLAKAKPAAVLLSPDDPAEKAKPSTTKLNAFVDLCHLAWARTRADLGNTNTDPGKMADRIDLAHRLIADIASDARQAKVIGQLANVALTRDKAKEGIIVTGLVGKITPVGSLHQVEVVLPSMGSQVAVYVVTVVCRERPKLELNDHVLVIGAVVNDPVDEIVGFQGTNERVVWAADFDRLAPADPPSRREP